MIPTLKTGRLILDGFKLTDAQIAERFAGDYELSKYTLNIPHPYAAGAAVPWMAGHPSAFKRGEGVTFAVRLANRTLVGSVGLEVERQHDRGELGYWIGRPFWGHGYATEAARSCMAFAFEHFGLHKIVASHFAANAVSGKVMEKLGMTKEGTRLRHTRKDGVFLDVVEYGLLRESFKLQTATLACQTGLSPSARAHPIPPDR